MTQPPDDEQPTVTWTPPEEPPLEPPTEPPTAAPTTDAAPDAAAPPMAPPTTPPTTPAEGQSPLISWAPSGGAAGAAPGEGAIVGWDAPSSALPPSAVEGYQTAGVGSRIVAWLLDGAILGLATLLVLVVVVIALGEPFVDDAVATSALTTILTVGFSFLYFVGFWTSASGATLGMRSLGMRVVEAPGPRPLGVGGAVVRWAALGYPVAAVTLVPVLGSIASWALVAWSIVLLITTAISDTNQGLHDRFANSAVLRRIGAGSGWAVVGCLILIGIAFVLLLILPLIALASLGPEFWDELQRQMILEMERQS